MDMTRIAHLSDLHFGAHDMRIVTATEAWLTRQRPDLVIISGDLTQRARVAQFRAAGAYIGRLRAAGLRVLPIAGNHDVPLYDIVRRFLAPLGRYRRFIDDDPCPWFEDGEVAILGINTARSLTIKGGRINREQMDIIRARFSGVAPAKTRILVTHHPLFAVPLGAGGELGEAVGRHEDAARAVRQAGVHIALAGHFHRTCANAAAKMAEDAGGALVIQAGTATSTRLRDAEPQSFNWLHVHRNDRIELQVVVWDGAAFRRAGHVEFRAEGGRWRARDAC